MNAKATRIDWFAPSGTPEQRAKQKVIDDRETDALIQSHHAVMEQLYPGTHPQHRWPTLMQRFTGRG